MLFIFSRLPSTHKGLISFFSAMIVFALFFLSDPEPEQHTQHLIIGQRYSININEQALSQNERPSSRVLYWEEYQVNPGESASLLFQRIGLPSILLYKLTSSNSDIRNQLSKLKAGDLIQFGFNEDSQLVQLKRVINAIETFSITKVNNIFTSKLEKKEVIQQYKYTEATITTNFWSAAASAGLSANQIMDLANIFGWDIDFALDIRKGDHFELLYQEQIVEGEAISQGKILTAIFTNQGTAFTAILDERTGYYYDVNGRAMEKAFLRSPIDFRRVTSDFNPNRRHPVTGKITAHRGTDYAAPVGTPVWSAGSGIVEKSGFNQFNGNYVFIRHDRKYLTKYLHLEKRLVKQGQRVKQGQTIGTLGSTGRVTGPHLHYEFLVNNVHQNPRTVSLPQSRSLTGRERSTFVANAKVYLRQLKRYSELFSSD